MRESHDDGYPVGQRGEPYARHHLHHHRSAGGTGRPRHAARTGRRISRTGPYGAKRLAAARAGPDWLQEYDESEIRELAARPEYSGAHGAFDTADLPDDPEREEEIDTLVSGSGSSDGSAGRFGDAEHGTA
jgi:hypothetical protein